MRDFLKNTASQIDSLVISSEQIDSYRKAVADEMLRFGTSDNELCLICDSILINSISNNRTARDTAWAILQ